MKTTTASILLALVLTASGCGDSSPSSPVDPGLPIALSCTTTSSLTDAPGQTWRVQVSLPGPDGRRAVLFTRGDLFAHSTQPPSTPVSFTARAAGRFDVIAVQLSFDGGRFDLGGYEGAEGSMWSGTADIHDDQGVAMSCWDPQWKPAFHYHPADGSCRNASGVLGTNWVLPGMPRELKGDECGKLDGMLNEVDLTQPQLSDWNLAGADLTAAQLEFADLPGADLRGADLTGFQYGYATFSGTIDAHTKSVPASGCTTSESAVSCSN